ncbi:MAG: ribonuclease P protein component [Gallionellaceae bacterium]|nr:ribonuclease P protein component [Gallionellaceae bacterium]
MRVLLSRPKQTLSSHSRLRQRSEFERALRANCLTNKWFAVYVHKNEGSIARLGVIASKKIMPKAVSRNFAKRLVREVFRCSLPENCALDVVVRAKRQLNPCTSREGRLALAQLLQAVVQR